MNDKMKWILFAVTLLMIVIFFDKLKTAIFGDPKKEEKDLTLATDFLNYKSFESLQGFIQYLDAHKTDKNGKIIKFYTPVLYPSNDIAISIATDIYDAKGFFNDDETKTFSAFSRLKSLADITNVQIWFNSLKVGGEGSILEFVNSYLNNAELARCTKLLHELPIIISKNDPTKMNKQIFK